MTLKLNPNQFQVNEAWIAFKLNDAPVTTDADGDFNVMALMDATSCFILGTAFLHASSPELSQLESMRLLKSGWSHKEKYPQKLFIATNQTSEILGNQAEGCGISVIRTPEEQLLVFVEEARLGFQEQVSRGRSQ